MKAYILHDLQTDKQTAVGSVCSYDINEAFAMTCAYTAWVLANAFLYL